MVFACIFANTPSVVCDPLVPAVYDVLGFIMSTKANHLAEIKYLKYGSKPSLGDDTGVSGYVLMDRLLEPSRWAAAVWKICSDYPATRAVLPAPTKQQKRAIAKVPEAKRQLLLEAMQHAVHTENVTVMKTAMLPVKPEIFGKLVLLKPEELLSIIKSKTHWVSVHGKVEYVSSFVTDCKVLRNFPTKFKTTNEALLEYEKELAQKQSRKEAGIKKQRSKKASKRSVVEPAVQENDELTPAYTLEF